MAQRAGRNTELAKVKAERILVENEIHQCGTARKSVEKSRKALFELETELEPLRAEIAELEKRQSQLLDEMAIEGYRRRQDE